VEDMFSLLPLYNDLADLYNHLHFPQNCAVVLKQQLANYTLHIHLDLPCGDPDKDHKPVVKGN
jgi:hypothetical protein